MKSRLALLALVGVVVVLTEIFVPVYAARRGRSGAAVVQQEQQQGGTLAHRRYQQRSSSAADEPLLSMQQQCRGFEVPGKALAPPLHPATTKRPPNFIYLLVDDMGYDDLSLHHPSSGMHTWVQTPHMDRLVRQGLELANFYTTPMCTTSRAELLTGRYYPRTGSMYINTGWDFMSTNETTLAALFADAGYKTAHFGKWHNGRTAGYTPSDVGFQYTYEPTPYVHLDNEFFINGEPTPTRGWMEEQLMSYALQWLEQRVQDKQPFLLYYPFYSVHAGWLSSSHAGPRYQRPAPPKYVDKFMALPLSADTAHLYAMLEHVDDQIGRLLDWLDSSGLAANTYVMLGGDNGPALFHNEERPVPKEVRMPSGMQGSKHEVLEGGIRNFLAIRGPGVQQGATNWQLTGLVDVLPTLVELAGIQVAQHAPWDGHSFANLLRDEPPTPAQQERAYVTMETQCIEDDFIPLLGPDRRVLKPQPLLDYNTGGVSGLGFQRCIGVRYKHYKWLSDASKTRGHGHSHMIGSRRAVPTALYRFQNNSHVELPCHEVTAAEPAMAARLEAMAEAWFADMLASAHSFDRPTFFLGIDGKPQANIVADAAMQRTPGRVVVVPMGVMGFEQPGDSSWYRVKVAVGGTYDVSLSQVAKQAATFRIWVGRHSDIQAGSAQHLDVQVQPGTKLAEAGSLQLPHTPRGETWELKVELRHNSRPGTPVLRVLDVIVLKLQGGKGPLSAYEPNWQEGVVDWKAAHGFLDN